MLAKRPIIFITTFFISGIITFNCFDQHFNLKFIILLFFIFLIFSVLALLVSKYQEIYLSLFFILGLLWGNFDKIPYNGYLNTIPHKTNIIVKGVVENIFRTKNNTKIILKVKDEKLLVFSKENINVNPGDIIKAKGKIIVPYSYQNPGVFSYSDYLKRKRIIRVMYLSNYKKVGYENANFRNISNTLQTKMLNSYSTLPSPYQELLGGIVLGSKAVHLPQDIEDIFRKVGTVHILVASGAQVSLLLIFCFYIFCFNKISNLPLKIIISFFMFLIIIFYATITEGDWPIIRAVIMGGVFLLSAILERDYDILSSLFFAAFLIALYSPNSIFDTGYQLSFSVCFGIAYIAPLIFNKLRKYKIEHFQNFYNFLCGIFSVTLSAQIMVLPIIAYYFHQISTLSLFANLITLPAVVVLLPLGLLSGVLGIISLKLSFVLNVFCGALLHFLLFVSQKILSLPFSSLSVFPPTVYEIVFYYLVVMAIINYRFLYQKLNIYRLTIIFLFLVVAFGGHKIFEQSNKLKVIFIDVGQGDSILVQTPQNKNILIDGGGSISDFDIGENVILPLLRYYRIKKLDMVILTHPHLDHIEGLLSILKNCNVDLVIDGKVDKLHLHEDKLYQRFLEIVKRRNIKHLSVFAGRAINLQKELSLVILNPQMILVKDTLSDIDNNGVVVKLKYKNISFLFTGDIYKEAEEILAKNFNLKSTFLKVAHHGSKTSSGENFLEKASPTFCIISVGRDNPWGHPNEEVINNLKGIGCSVFRTDTDGAIIVQTNGKNGEITLWGKKENYKF